MIIIDGVCESNELLKESFFGIEGEVSQNGKSIIFQAFERTRGDLGRRHGKEEKTLTHTYNYIL